MAKDVLVQLLKKFDRAIEHSIHSRRALEHFLAVPRVQSRVVNDRHGLEERVELRELVSNAKPSNGL